MRDRRRQGSTTASLMLLLAVAVGAGGWNYHRNLEREQASASGRTYAGYSTREVELLRAAATSEIEARRNVAEHRKLQEVLDQELARRAELGTGLALHLRRLTDISS
jgi:hypothetical protein